MTTISFLVPHPERRERALPFDARRRVMKRRMRRGITAHTTDEAQYECRALMPCWGSEVRIKVPPTSDNLSATQHADLLVGSKDRFEAVGCSFTHRVRDWVLKNPTNTRAQG